MRYSKATAIFLLAAAAVFLTCSETGRDNPYDPNTEVLILTLLSPSDSSVIRVGTPVLFKVSARTGFDDTPAGSRFWWRSDLAGLLATRASFTTDSLPVGTHRISVTVADSLDRRGSRTFSLNILPLPEFGVMITQPPADTTFIIGSAFTPAAREFVPAGRSIIGRQWKFGQGSGIPDTSAASPGEVTWNKDGTFELIYQIVDDRGRIAADTSVVHVLAESTPPEMRIVSPAADTAIVRNDSLYLEAFDQETAARIARRGWIYPAGSGYEGVIDDTTATAGWRKFATPGIFDIFYYVTDLLGITVADTVRITVHDTLPAPQAGIIRPHARDTTIVAGDSIRFEGFLIPRAESITQKWDFGANSGIPADSVMIPGWKVFTLTGTFKVIYEAGDMSGRRSRDSVSVSVGANQPPTARIDQPPGNLSIGQGVSYTFIASDSDPDNRPLRRYWLWPPASGITPSPADSAANSGSRTFNSTGVFSVSYHVIDDKGLHAADTAIVTVSANTPPTATITSPSIDTTLAAWAEIIFRATDSDPGGSIGSRTWNFGAGSGLLPDTTAVTPPKYFGTAGTFTITYTVRDNLLALGRDSVLVTVTANDRPTAMITSLGPQNTISVGDSLSFLAIDSDADGIASRSWNYGAGSGLPPDTIKTPDFRRFNNPGTFTVVYRVVDNRGGVNADTVIVKVNP